MFTCFRDWGCCFVLCDLFSSCCGPVAVRLGGWQAFIWHAPAFFTDVHAFLLRVPTCDTHASTIPTLLLVQITIYSCAFYFCPEATLWQHISPAVFVSVFQYFFCCTSSFLPFLSRPGFHFIALMLRPSQSSHGDGSSKLASRLTSLCFITARCVFFHWKQLICHVWPCFGSFWPRLSVGTCIPHWEMSQM